MGWKTKAVFTWIGLEIAILPFAIPATAQIAERIALAFPPRVTAVELGSEPGVARYVVASNAPFSVISEGIVGDVDIAIHVSGHILETPFGTKAQSPGPLNACATIHGAAPRIIYSADRKTAAKRGKVLEQSIIVEVHYDPITKPTLRFEAFAKNDKIHGPRAKSCKPKLG